FRATQRAPRPKPLPHDPLCVAAVLRHPPEGGAQRGCNRTRSPPTGNLTSPCRRGTHRKKHPIIDAINQGTGILLAVAPTAAFSRETLMPVKFLNPNDPKAVRKQQALHQKIDRWWEAFRARTPDLVDLFTRRKQWDLPGWMEENLQGINKHLMWEFGADKNGGHRLVITPEAEKHLRPLVDTILERAPSVAGWTFYPYRQPETLEDAEATVEARTGGDLTGVQVFARIGEFNRVNLLFQSP